MSLGHGGRLMFSLLVNVFCTGAAAQVEQADGALPSGLIHLRAVDPTVLQDIRYATANNFTGAPVVGYGAGECVLTVAAARALALVQADLKREGLALKVYDCYRPPRAVAAFADWAQRPATELSRDYHPNIDKSRLFDLGYIARQSRHSTGDTVDLTLVTLAPDADVSTVDAASGRARQGTMPCSGPVDKRAPDSSLDMGTGYDCFDLRSATDSPLVTALQKRRRLKLVRAMAVHGFQNYRREWWHFSLSSKTLINRSIRP
jgi:zinc D-Ala-D-Ala dipeptidase